MCGLTPRKTIQMILPGAITRVHVAAFALAFLSLFAQLTPAGAKTIKASFINPGVVFFPNAGEWNCKDKPASHWCHRKVKRSARL